MTSELLSHDRDSNSALLPEMSHTFNHTLYQIKMITQRTALKYDSNHGNIPHSNSSDHFQCPSNAFSMLFFQSSVK